MPDPLNEILNEALPQWATLTRTKLGTSSYTFRIGSDSEFQDYDLKKYVDDLNAARELDTSGTTAILLLRGLFDAYTRELSLKVHTLLFAPTGAEERLSQLRAFHALITRPPCEEAVHAFRDTVRGAATHYGYDLQELQGLLGDERALGNLRLAAARSLETLDVHQFAQGRPDPAPLQYNREIFEFTSINSFVVALHKQWVSGITLALVRDGDTERDTTRSFFVLGLRNGENITVLTDRDGGAHPAYHQMSRRPERQLEERAARHWFPYRLLDQDPVRRAKCRRALVPKDGKAVPIEEVPGLSPPEFLWLTLLLGLIAEKYGGNFRTDELSYTGEMVVEPHALLGSHEALVITGHYQPLLLPSLTPETSTREAADTRVPVGHNAWMEERYRHRVPGVLLNVVGERQALEAGKRATRLLPGQEGEDQLPPVRRQRNVLISWGPDLRRTELHPHALDPTCFGTRAQIERDRAWAARMNLMQGIQRLAVDDFVKKHELVRRWYRARVTRNMRLLWGAVARGELRAPVLRWVSDGSEAHPSHDAQVWTEGNILRQEIARHRRDAFSGVSAQTVGVEIGAWDDDRRCVLCGIDSSLRASVFTVIQPDNPRALALLCGIPERKLPWPLQHWWTSEPYTGNPILDRIDPQDWKLDNPWRHLELRICISLSKRAFNRLRREHGLPAGVLGAQEE